VLPDPPVIYARISDVQEKIKFNFTNKIQLCDQQGQSKLPKSDHRICVTVATTSVVDFKHCAGIGSPIDLHHQ
jgi:hypothetical protein